MGMNTFGNVIAAVMLPRDFFREGEEKVYIYVYGHYMRAMTKGRGLSRLKVDVSHVACYVDISRTARHYPAVRCM